MQLEFRTIIVPADQAELARALSSGLSPAGAGMFTTALSPASSKEVTHYVSTGLLGKEFTDLMPLFEVSDQTVDGEPAVLVKVSEGQPETIVQAAAALGLEVTLEQVKELFDTSDSTAQEPFAAFARLGLELHQEDTSPNP